MLLDFWGKGASITGPIWRMLFKRIFQVARLPHVILSLHDVVVLGILHAWAHQKATFDHQKTILLSGVCAACGDGRNCRGPMGGACTQRR